MNDLQNFLEEYEKIAVPDDQIDTSDCPELTDEQIKNAKRVHPRKPKNANRHIIIGINDTLADHLQAIGDNWESKVNDVLMNAYAAGQI